VAKNELAIIEKKIEEGDDEIRVVFGYLIYHTYKSVSFLSFPNANILLYKLQPSARAKS
jgi:hypothetical protein